MKKLMILLMLTVLLSCSSLAANVADMQQEAFGTGQLEDAMPEDAQDILGDMEITSADFDDGLQSILSSTADEFSGILGQALKKTGVILAIVMLGGLVGTIRETELGSFPPIYMTLASTLAITAVSAGSINSFVGLGTETIEKMMVFSKSLLPAMAAAVTASGRGFGASSMYVAATLFCDFFITITDRVITPLVYMFIAAAAAESAVGGGMAGRIAALFKWAAVTLLKTVLLCFTAYLSISGIVSGSADAVAIKAAKVTLSGVVPVVGSIISDASETVLLSASVLKNGIGIFGMLCILAVCAIPFLNLGVHYLAYKVCGAFSAAIGGGTETKLIDAIGSALGIVLAMTAVCALMLLVSCVAAMKAVSV